jgi:hypothetical protein
VAAVFRNLLQVIEKPGTPMMIDDQISIVLDASRIFFD